MTLGTRLHQPRPKGTARSPTIRSPPGVGSDANLYVHPGQSLAGAQCCLRGSRPHGRLRHPSRPRTSIPRPRRSPRGDAIRAGRTRGWRGPSARDWPSRDPAPRTEHPQGPGWSAEASTALPRLTPAAAAGGAGRRAPEAAAAPGGAAPPKKGRCPRTPTPPGRSPPVLTHPPAPTRPRTRSLTHGAGRLRLRLRPAAPPAATARTRPDPRTRRTGGRGLSDGGGGASWDVRACGCV